MFAFSYSGDYERLQQEYLACVATHDVQAVLYFSHAHPYHVDCCLQMAELCESQGEFIAAHAHVQRALHMLDVSMHRDFELNSVSRTHALPPIIGEPATVESLLTATVPTRFFLCHVRPGSLSPGPQRRAQRVAVHCARSPRAHAGQEGRCTTPPPLSQAAHTAVSSGSHPPLR